MMENQAAAAAAAGVPFQHLVQQQQQQLQMFWNYQRQEIEQGACDFKNHQLPLARIKKIMKADEDVRMISAEAPILFAKACELFILELTIRSWLHAEENKRRTLQKNDIAAAITRTDIFDFLVDIVPRDADIKDDAASGGPAAGIAAGASLIPGVLPYYYPPPAGPPGMMIGRPAALDPAMGYLHQQPPPAQPGWQPMWQATGLPDDGGAYGHHHHHHHHTHPPSGLDDQPAYGNLLEASTVLQAIRFRQKMNWVQRKIYLYNVTFGLYMLEWWERYLFNILVIVLFLFMFHNGSRAASEFYRIYFKSKLPIVGETSHP
ncbi:hypothetical protein H6P81_012005 [Aristolochia fimbriata]|uniref:Core Histone H2A/H2B/H3 domain-containing protein n=1 Tax=Aristolochia fimbriata TaxID=158543 RepID=A0AAV7EDU5_ARIFI|nr:hypothetical protein H6P81_012005 [Aristolochia fimbriata]